MRQHYNVPSHVDCNTTRFLEHGLIEHLDDFGPLEDGFYQVNGKLPSAGLIAKLCLRPYPKVKVRGSTG
jgi:hypothetical protein